MLDKLNHEGKYPIDSKRKEYGQTALLMEAMAIFCKSICYEHILIHIFWNVIEMTIYSVYNFMFKFDSTGQ